ncbi:universal stress protein [Microlunatus parietis]
MDGSPANQSAVGYAFDAAARRYAPLIALHAWKFPPAPATCCHWSTTPPGWKPTSSGYAPKPAPVGSPHIPTSASIKLW